MAASLSSKAQIARSAVIKGLAAALMVVDHVGVVFFPGTPLFRYLGRLSFPLFCWLLAQGERRTRDVYRYGLRLLAFGLLSQPPYSALFGGFQLNVLFTLLVGLVTLRLARERPQWAYFIWPLGVMISALIPMDGGGYGVAVMLLMAQPMTLRWWGFWVL
ncbi:MAG: TraX family protein, partial [Cyanobacteria bacterium P01_A01_bin.135]